MFTHEMNREEIVTLLREYREALVRLDEVGLMLGGAVIGLEIDWLEGELGLTGSNTFNPLKQIVRQMQSAVPESIKAARVIENENVQAG